MGRAGVLRVAGRLHKAKAMDMAVAKHKELTNLHEGAAKNGQADVVDISVGKCDTGNLHRHSRPPHNATPFTKNPLFLCSRSLFHISPLRYTLRTLIAPTIPQRRFKVRLHARSLFPFARASARCLSTLHRSLYPFAHAPTRCLSALRRLFVSLCPCACLPPFHLVPLACIPSHACPFALSALCCSLFPLPRLADFARALSASRFLLPSCFLLHLALPLRLMLSASLTSLARSPPRAPLRLALPSASPHLCLASPAKPSQAPNMIKTGGIGQPSQEWYQYDEEMNSISCFPSASRFPPHTPLVLPLRLVLPSALPRQRSRARR
ncbi:hypothetical protein B0H13DRAFT_2344899 [Mycena leptocephala]|nr:hypothetical protein B0H13DRAFT_2344899 [Mycena leptocephala]